MTSIPKKVSDYLTEIGVHHFNEYYIEGVNVDIYIPESSKVIECNGEFWHGNPLTLAPDKMSIYQRNGYNRDLRRRDIFGDRVLFLWESEINNGSYVDKLSKFLNL